jgi:predicted Zn-dependent protease
LATRSTFRQNQVIDPRQVRLTAAHEMGHALGILMHSDSERDVMYPTNTATSLSAQDYRTMEVLYSLADGTRIIR